MINWTSTENHLLLNPRMPAEQLQFVEASWQKVLQDRARLGHPIESHVALATSGSSGSSDSLISKLVLLSKSALLASARGVIKHFDISELDVWLNTLPKFHVGGLGIYARAHVMNSPVVELDEWDVEKFVDLIDNNNVTWTSLVPSQVFDIVQNHIQAPPSLRGVVVGGGALNQDLFVFARRLKWPILPSFGMTEAGSQIATAITADIENKLTFPPLKVLPHFQLRVDDEQRIRIHSPALLTAYVRVSHDDVVYDDPKEDGWLLTEDRGELMGPSGRELKILGRTQDFLKIGGESVLFSKLEAIFEQMKLQVKPTWDASLLPVPNDRLGAEIHMLVTTQNRKEIEDLQFRFNQMVMPFEKIREVHYCAQIPRSPLGKLLRSKALAMIGMKS